MTARDRIVLAEAGARLRWLARAENAEHRNGRYLGVHACADIVRAVLCRYAEES